MVKTAYASLIIRSGSKVYFHPGKEVQQLGMPSDTVYKTADLGRNPILTLLLLLFMTGYT